MPKKTSPIQILTGRYMGLMRHAKRTVKSKARTIRAKKGLRAAIAFLRKHSK